jgi:hypothetical protein
MTNFDGELFLSTDAGFEDAAMGRIFNGRRPDRRPEAVLFAESDNDLKQAVALAKEKGWQIAIRSGGHSWAAWSVREGSLLVDLSRLQEVSMDQATGIATARPALKGGEVLDPWLAERDRFFNGGHCPTVGIGGFLLQGGQGWCARGWGWAAESVVAIDVLTAAGEIVRADANQNQDLYWAARGAGPSFPGIVTNFHLQTRPRFKHVGHTVQVFKMSDFKEVMQWMYEAHNQISPDVEIVCVSLTPPSVNGEPRERVFVVTGVALVDSHEEAAIALAPFQENPIIDRALVNEKHITSSLAQQREEQIRMNPEHWRYFVDNIWVDGETDEIIEKIEPLFRDLPEPEAFTIWFSMGPVREIPDMAFSMQSEIYFSAYTVWEDEADDERMQGWTANAVRTMEPWTKGQYLGDSDLSKRQVKFMSDENFAKLKTIQAVRDPQNLFVGYLAGPNGATNRNHWEP